MKQHLGIAVHGLKFMDTH